MATIGTHKPMGWLWHVKKWLGFKVRPRKIHLLPITFLEQARRHNEKHNWTTVENSLDKTLANLADLPNILDGVDTCIEGE